MSPYPWIEKLVVFNSEGNFMIHVVVTFLTFSFISRYRDLNIYKLQFLYLYEGREEGKEGWRERREAG